MTICLEDFANRPNGLFIVSLRLSLVFLGIVVQQLIPKACGQGRVVACEIMSGNLAKALTRR